MLSCGAVFKSFENSRILKQGFFLFPLSQLKIPPFIQGMENCVLELSEGKHTPELAIWTK